MATGLMLFIIAVDLEKSHRLSAKFEVVQDRSFFFYDGVYEDARILKRDAVSSSKCVTGVSVD